MQTKPKVLVLLGDGMADEPLESLQNQTVLEYASTPAMDSCVAAGVIGMAETVPEGMQPGSDTANLSIFGYNPQHFFTGRAPLETLNLGIELGTNDVAFRCNFVSIENGTMKDFTAGHIETKFAEKIIELLNERAYPNIEFYTGVSYRNCMVWRDFPYADIPSSTPPHDIQGQKVETFLPKGDGCELLLSIIEETKAAIEALQAKYSELKGTPTSVWLWGGGRKPNLVSYNDKYGISGVTISAVDLIHGIGRAAGLKPLYVDGATGYLDTNYENKVSAACKALETEDFVFLHVEAPDESGHEGSVEHKIEAIEDFDKRVVAPILRHMQDEYEEFTLLIMPDHPTPVSIKTHTANPVPFIIYSTDYLLSNITHIRQTSYSEKSAEASGLYFPDASRLMDLIIKHDFRTVGQT